VAVSIHRRWLAPKPRKPVRLVPGVVIVALQWLVLLVLPAVMPGTSGIALMAAEAGLGEEHGGVVPVDESGVESGEKRQQRDRPRAEGQQRRPQTSLDPSAG
jgi:hypothetical protein